MFVVYLTIYSGNKLPPFYIGSTSLKKYSSGYCGTITSQAYRTIYTKEIRESPELFDVVLLETCRTREHALIQELFWQKRVNAKTSSDYFNMSWAQPNGFMGRDTSGKNHPLFGSHNAKGYIHSYDPITFKASFSLDVPPGNVLGRVPTVSRANFRGKRWFTNGSKDMFCKTCPDGFKAGRTTNFRRKAGTKKAYTNGIISKYFDIGREPLGWVPGFGKRRNK